ncbi:hypothetical protein PPL_10533 [Heterostelium album PN500]|uniref:Rap-GAP domain-containing protein n=1 Tax=Heterostelium pallidum (strain ATCC 26659 / Pp 5 / PN500) TaxID=670386 RepID=D3BRC5_HETP5|nr:hypothetical protein PPL_10533 [Heterostelium album PN500]EFA75957.1 hypothetical protein PPL_10533 [Heterostelium album PN500]|eukprot:XP_020428091.1 hypothetical protein PPL_10533 [Heterostelium album PN500]
MDSFLTFGLCEKALEFQVECEFPNQTTKQYQFHSRHTVDKIKSSILSDAPELNKQEYTLAIDNEQLSVDFIRFIVSNPKITETLEKGPIVKIQLIPKSNYTSSSSFSSQREKISLGENKMSELKMTLEKSPVVSRLAGGGRPMVVGGAPMIPDNNHLRVLKKTREENLKREEQREKEKEKENEKEQQKEQKEKEKEQKQQQKEQQQQIKKEKKVDRAASPTPPTPTVTASPDVSTNNLLEHLNNNNTNDLPPATTAEKYATLSSLKHLTLGSGQPSTTNSPATTNRPRTQEYSSPVANQAETADEQEVELIKDYSLIDNIKGFTIESYKKGLVYNDLILDTLITSESWYANHFPVGEHYNYVGDDDKSGPFIISICKEKEKEKEKEEGSGSNNSSPKEEKSSFLKQNVGSFKILLRTKSSDIFTTVNPKGSILFSSNKIPIKEIVQSVAPDLPTKSIKMIKSQDIQKDLKNFEERQRVKSFKFGVLYCAANQSVEEEMFSNEFGSDDFNEFLSILGERIQLQGWQNYRGGLDVKSNTTGTESIYEKYQGFEIMFHVATMLPYSHLDTQQVEKKRHIGNDIVVIIFKEGDKPFNPNIIQSDFNHVFIVVSVDKSNMSRGGAKRYKLSVVYKDGVGSSKPSLEYPCSFEANQDFKNYLLCKLINSECASYEAPSFKIKIQRTRIALLKDMLNTYSND